MFSLKSRNSVIYLYSLITAAGLVLVSCKTGTSPEQSETFAAASKPEVNFKVKSSNQLQEDLSTALRTYYKQSMRSGNDSNHLKLDANNNYVLDFNGYIVNCSDDDCAVTLPKREIPKGGRESFAGILFEAHKMNSDPRLISADGTVSGAAAKMVLGKKNDRRFECEILGGELNSQYKCVYFGQDK